MHGTPHSPRSLPARLALGLVSVALLACAFFPLTAQATDAYEVEYRDAPPVATGANPGKDGESRADASDADDGGSDAGVGGTVGSGGGHSGEKSSSTGDRAGSKNADRGTGQGSPEAGSGGKEGSDLQAGSQLGADAAEEDDGTSPLVPILAALAALAAISIATVMLRQRRQRQGPGSTPASPEAN